MKIQRKQNYRQQIKSSEGEFLYELGNSYELSPKLCEQILITAKGCLLRDYPLKEGQIETTVIGIEERSGKLLEKMEKKRVRLRIDNGIEDAEALKEYGRRGLRQIKIQRDIREIKKRGVEVITRGYLHNIGR
ncbi:MAG: hypothetical protein QME52_02155, partial [Bacteroidota bacterium]|nr:hypothetical protein [Bacteroidota bacterium]